MRFLPKTVLLRLKLCEILWNFVKLRETFNWNFNETFSIFKNLENSDHYPPRNPSLIRNLSYQCNTIPLTLYLVTSLYVSYLTTYMHRARRAQEDEGKACALLGPGDTPPAFATASRRFSSKISRRNIISRLEFHLQSFITWKMWRFTEVSWKFLEVS